MAKRPDREAAEEAVRTLIAWAGDAPDRDGLVDTPRRVLDAYAEFFAGYQQNAESELARTFEARAGYDDLVLVRDIPFTSHCEHHMLPFIGRAHLAYYPEGRVVGLSKLARAVDVYAHRLQTQERLTAEIAQAMERALKPRGIAVLIQAEHQCMTLRGVRKPGTLTTTTMFLGAFKDPAQQIRFLGLVGAEGRSSR